MTCTSQDIKDFIEFLGDQKLSEEMTNDDHSQADFEGAYNLMVLGARKLLPIEACPVSEDKKQKPDVEAFVAILTKISLLANGRDSLDGFPRSAKEKQRRLAEIYELAFEAISNINGVKQMTTVSSEPTFMTSQEARGFLVGFFNSRLNRQDFNDYINKKLAGDFACTMAEALSDLFDDLVEAEAKLSKKAELVSEDILVPDPVIDALKQCRDCWEDGEDVDIGLDKLKALEVFGYLHKVGRKWEITDIGMMRLEGE